MGTCSVLNAKLWGAVHGLRLAWDKKCLKVVLEMDNQLAVNMIKGSMQVCNRSKALVLEIRRMLTWNWEVTITHSYREGNRCADFLANASFNFPFGFYPLHAPFQGLRDLLMQDIMGVAFP